MSHETPLELESDPPRLDGRLPTLDVSTTDHAPHVDYLCDVSAFERLRVELDERPVDLGRPGPRRSLELMAAVGASERRRWDDRLARRASFPRGRRAGELLLGRRVKGVLPIVGRETVGHDRAGVVKDYRGLTLPGPQDPTRHLEVEAERLGRAREDRALHGRRVPSLASNAAIAYDQRLSAPEPGEDRIALERLCRPVEVFRWDPSGEELGGDVA